MESLYMGIGVDEQMKAAIILCGGVNKERIVDRTRFLSHKKGMMDYRVFDVLKGEAFIIELASWFEEFNICEHVLEIILKKIKRWIEEGP